MIEARRVRFIVNPSARSGRARSSLYRARSLAANRHRLRLEWIESNSGAHLTALVQSSQGEDLDALAIGGGDGTVALALGGMVGPNRVPISVLPVGSGNDFAHDLGISGTIPQAVEVLAAGVPRWVDVVRVTPGGSRYCCVASVGLDEMALRIIHASWLPRSKALNIWAALRALWAYRPKCLRVDWEGGAFEGEVMFVAVTNTRSYGGGFLVSPGAKIDDGLLDLCIVKRTSRARLLWKFPSILAGTHGGLPEVIQATSSWVRISGVSESLPVTLDGELPHLVTPVEFRCEPGALQVLAPPLPRKRGPRVEEPSCHP